MDYAVRFQKIGAVLIAQHLGSNARCIALLLGIFALLPSVAIAQAPQPGGTLTAIIQPEPVILTAAINTAAPTGTVSGNIFDGLVDYDTNLNPQPALADHPSIAEGCALA
jgi:peptide/nickel transport system substrate-binding protein